MKAYEDPNLPDDAPTWARDWCSTPGRGMPEKVYHSIRSSGLVTSEMGFRSVLDTAIELPPQCMIAFKCAIPDCKCNREELIMVVLGVGRPSPLSESYVIVCSEPLICRRDGLEHPHVPASMCRLMGFRFGVTSDVMRAIYDGRPYEDVRAMTLAPCFKN